MRTTHNIEYSNYFVRNGAYSGLIGRDNSYKIVLTMMQQQITQYVRGQLSEDQAISLWTQLLLRPQLLDMLMIELQLKWYYAKKRR